MLNRLNFSNRDLSIIFQGAISPEFSRQAIGSARHFFPKAEIIISTWNGSDAGFIIGHDKVVYSQDPGPVAGPAIGNANLNRQIVSSLAGLRESSRPVCIKVRLDCVFIRPDCIDYFNIYRKMPALDYTARIMACNCYTLRHDPAYICDYWYMGYRWDLLQMFHVEEIDYAHTHIGPEHYLATCNYRYNPKENFVILDSERQAGIINCKYPHQQNRWTQDILSYDEWQFQQNEYERLKRTKSRPNVST